MLLGGHLIIKSYCDRFNSKFSLETTIEYANFTHFSDRIYSYLTEYELDRTECYQMAAYIEEEEQEMNLG